MILNSGRGPCRVCARMARRDGCSGEDDVVIGNEGCSWKGWRDATAMVRRDGWSSCGMMYGDGDLMLIAIQCLLGILSLLLIEERRRVVDGV